MAPPCHKISGFLAAAYLHEFTFFSSHADFTGSACSFLPGCKSDIEDARSAFRFNGLQIAPGEFRPKAELVQGALYFPDWKEMRTLSALEHKRTHDNHPSLAFTVLSPPVPHFWLQPLKPSLDTVSSLCLLFKTNGPQSRSQRCDEET